MPAYTPEDADRLLCEAISAGDLEAALALYEPEARFVAEPGNVVTGSEAIRQVMSQFLALQPTLTLETVTAVQAGDIALLSSTWSLAGSWTRWQACEHVGPEASGGAAAARWDLALRDRRPQWPRLTRSDPRCSSPTPFVQIGGCTT